MIKGEIIFDKFNIQNELRFDDYDSLLNSDFVDAVYISTPHTLHANLSIKAAGNGLCIYYVKNQMQ